MLKIAIVGCGKIADDHAAQIQRIDGCEIVGVCDREALMAKQLYERFPVKLYADNVEELIDRAKPDVVHVTTPPQSHFEIAKFCLEQGCHVYVEKPFTLNTREAQPLIALAQKQGLKLTVGHDDQFSHVARRMRAMVKQGYLGREIVHMESYFGYDLSDPAYARAFLSDKQHWVHKLPGQLFQNIISHGIARIAEYLPSDEPEVIAHGFVSPLLRSMGEKELVDELRVTILAEGTSAYFTFSSHMRPSLHEFRIYGTSNGLIVDQDHETLIRLRGKRFKSYADKFVPPALQASHLLGELATNVRSFLRRDFQMKAGMKCLIESFYRSILLDTAVPIPYREIILTAQIMDAIFSQLAQDSERRRSSQPAGEEVAAGACHQGNHGR